MKNPPFRKIAIIGVGFMGGSLALSLKEVFPGVVLSGYARNENAYRLLKKSNIVHAAETELEKVIRDSDIVVLGLPVYTVMEYFKEIGPLLKKGAIVFDLGSTKTLIEKYAKKYLPSTVRFVGCHPLCGSEKQGFAFSHAGLYKNSVCVITSSPQAKTTKVVKELWEALGSHVVFLPAPMHDKIVSSISHFPHVLSFALTHFVPKNYIKFSSMSFKDLTRISNSPARIWSDIFFSNSENIIRDIEQFIKTLHSFQKMIKSGNRKELSRFIDSVNKKQKLIALAGASHSSECVSEKEEGERQKTNDEI